MAYLRVEALSRNRRGLPVGTKLGTVHEQGSQGGSKRQKSSIRVATMSGYPTYQDLTA